jgi:hypothetical protein
VAKWNSGQPFQFLLDPILLKTENLGDLAMSLAWFLLEASDSNLLNPLAELVAQAAQRKRRDPDGA